MKQRRQKRNIGTGASATVGEQEIFSLSCSLLHGAAVFCSDVGSFCERLQLLGSGKCVYGQYWSLDPCLCLDVGEVSASGNTRKTLVDLTNAPPVAPVTMASTPDWWLSQSWGADWKQGKGSGTVAYARHPPPWRSRGDWTRRGVGKEEWMEMWGECDLLKVTRKRERESASSPGPEWVLWCWLTVKHLQAKKIGAAFFCVILLEEVRLLRAGQVRTGGGLHQILHLYAKLASFFFLVHCNMALLDYYSILPVSKHL